MRCMHPDLLTLFPILGALRSNGDSEDGSSLLRRRFFRQLSPSAFAQVLSREREREPKVLRDYYELTDDIECLNFDHSSLFYSACCDNKPAVARWLLEHGANPNSVDEDGRSPAFWAVDNQITHLIRLLISFGAQPLFQQRNLDRALGNPNGPPNPDFLPWFHLVKHFRSLHMSIEARDTASVLRVLHSGASPFTAVPSPKRSLTPYRIARTKLASPLALDVCSETKALVKAAIKAWTDTAQSHAVRPAATQANVYKALAILHKLNRSLRIKHVPHELVVMVAKHASVVYQSQLVLFPL